jgi:glycosyltransferase involved in cell wall biosynthesis
VNKPKLLVLVSPRGDAMKRDVLWQASALRATFELFCVAHPDETAAYEALGVAVDAWNPIGDNGIKRALGTLRTVLTSFVPDIVHAHGFSAIALALGAFAEPLSGRTIAFFHDLLRGEELPDKFVIERFPQFVQRAAQLVCVTPSLAGSLERMLHLEAGRIVVIPHGIAPSFAAEYARPSRRAGPLLGWSGRLRGERSWGVAIDALALVAKALPDARLTIAGDGPAKSIVESYASDKRLSAKVDFGGALSNAALFAGIDLLLVPRSDDAQPQVLLEALSWGMPVIAGDGGALADALHACDAELLVEDDAAGFARGISETWLRIDDAWDRAATKRAAARTLYERGSALDRIVELDERILSAAR